MMEREAQAIALAQTLLEVVSLKPSIGVRIAALRAALRIVESVALHEESHAAAILVDAVLEALAPR